jgi:ribose-phosphate pyrophosphokinase
MIVFALPGFEAMVPAQLGPGGTGRIDVQRFANGELEVVLGTDVQGRRCSLLGSVAPPDAQLASLLLSAHTVKREGAAEINAVLPYLAYARQDEPEHGRSLAVAWIGSQLAAAGIDRVVAIDVHSPQARELFPIPLTSLSPAPLFAAELRALELEDPTIVSPDEGAIDRCSAVVDETRITRPVAFLRKERGTHGVRHTEIVGALSANVVIVDDILDTGATLLSCCAELRRRGVERIVVMATHGLFTGSRWEALWAAGVERVFVTDSVPAVAQRPPVRVEIISTAPIVDRAIVGAQPAP